MQLSLSFYFFKSGKPQDNQKPTWRLQVMPFLLEQSHMDPHGYKGSCEIKFYNWGYGYTQ